MDLELERGREIDVGWGQWVRVVVLEVKGGSFLREIL